MAIDIIVPPLSQTSDTLILSAWLKKVGEPVKKGEALFEVETDKATLEVEAPASGILREVLAEPGSEVAVRARIGSIAASAAEEAAVAATSPTPVHTLTAAPAAASAPTTAGLPPERAARILASPRARRLADQANLPLAGLPATGPRGMIVERDVRAYLATHAAPAAAIPATQAAPLSAATPAPVSAKSEGRTVPLSATRRTIARRLQASHQSTTPVTLNRDVDATELVALRTRLLLDLEAQAPRLTYTDLLVSMAARCLARHPNLNATFDGENLELYESVHMGLAVDTERGLLVPVLRDVARKGLIELAGERSALAQRAREGTLTPAELAGGSFTLTNLGALGVDSFTPLLNPPQVAILGLGRIRPVVGWVDGAASPRQAMFLSLTFDHRAVDGAPAARLLADIAALVERPDRVWL